MKPLVLGLLSLAGLATSGSAVNAQYYWPGYGYYPGVNQTVISVSPYWRPLVINTPVVATSLGPNYYYSNYYGFHATPFGYNWSAYRYQWANAPYYFPPAVAYPTYPVPVVPVRGRIYPGFVPTVRPFAAVTVPAATTVVPVGGSFTAWGAYMPATGAYLNPYSGAVVVR